MRRFAEYCTKSFAVLKIAVTAGKECVMQQLFLCICFLLLNLIIYYLLGQAVCVRYRWNLLLPEIICVGFFLYFAFFQVIAEIMIFTKQKLHVLGNVWLAVLILLLAAAVSVVYTQGRVLRRQKENENARPMQAAVFGGFQCSKMDNSERLLLGVMALAIACECAAAVLMQRNIGWDFAYYIGNMATSAATDTMYLYDGSSGLLRNKIDLRYALSSFYMNTAWASRMMGVSALALQKYAMGVLCVLLTNAVVYSFAMEVFGRDRKKSAALVIFTIILTIFWDVYDTSAQFLMLRGYEAKAYCANVVLPMALYLLYRIWKDESDIKNWAELFLTAFASVAVSMSSLILVPALIGIMLLAHLFIERHCSAAFIRRAFYCMMPNICYFLVYFSYTRGWLVVEV